MESDSGRNQPNCRWTVDGEQDGMAMFAGDRRIGRRLRFEAEDTEQTEPFGTGSGHFEAATKVDDRSIFEGK